MTKLTANPPKGQSRANRVTRLWAIMTPTQRQRAAQLELAFLNAARRPRLSPRQRLHLLESVVAERVHISLEGRYQDEERHAIQQESVL